MSDALRAFQFPPEHCQVASSPRYFMMQLHAYLRSGIPVILGIETGGEGHAVTAVGFRHDARLKDSVDIPVGDRSVSLRLRNLTYRQIYVHDDRLGPYARATLQPRSRRGPVRGARTSANCGSEEEKNGRRRTLGLTLERPDGSKENARVHLALAPLYPKLRTSAEELIDHSRSCLRHTSTTCGRDYQASCSSKCSSTGREAIQADLYSRPLDPRRPCLLPDGTRSQSLRGDKPLVHW